MSHKGRTVYKLQGAETCQRTQHNSAIIGTRNTCAVLAVNLLKHVGSPDTMLKVTQLHGVNCKYKACVVSQQVSGIELNKNDDAALPKLMQRFWEALVTRASEELCIAVVVAACCAVLAGWLMWTWHVSTAQPCAFSISSHQTGVLREPMPLLIRHAFPLPERSCCSKVQWMLCCCSGLACPLFLTQIAHVMPQEGLINPSNSFRATAATSVAPEPLRSHWLASCESSCVLSRSCRSCFCSISSARHPNSRRT